MQGIHISAMGCYLPAQVVKNQDFERLVETSDERIVTHTGVRAAAGYPAGNPPGGWESWRPETLWSGER